MISNAMIPEFFPSERRVRFRAIPNETACRMRIESQKEWYEQVMCVPKRLKRLLADSMMRRGVHEQHAEEHYMPSHSACLGIVNLQRFLGPKLLLLDVIEAATR